MLNSGKATQYCIMDENYACSTLNSMLKDATMLYSTVNDYFHL